MDDRFANPFANVRRLHPDYPGDRALIMRTAQGRGDGVTVALWDLRASVRRQE